MTHHEIQSFTDLPTARVALQNQFSPLEQERGLGRVLLGCKLLKTAIKVFRNGGAGTSSTVTNGFLPLQDASASFS